MFSVENQIANEMKVKPEQVAAAIALIDDGATVPFIARYRKEATNGLNDVQLRYLEERLLYLNEFIARREAILTKLKTLEKLTPELEQALMAATIKTELEDLYRPHKPKRKTKAQIALQAGLGPLAQALEKNQDDVLGQAEPYLNAEHQIETAEQAVEGAKAILIEQYAEHPEALKAVRQMMLAKSMIHSALKPKQESHKAANKYQDYYDHAESLAKVPSHRALAMLRGRKAGILRIQLIMPTGDDKTPVNTLIEHLGLDKEALVTGNWLYDVVDQCWKTKIYPHIEADLFGDMRENAEETAIQVFSQNIRDVLMASPAGPKVILGVDPAIRTGIKVAVIDKTGEVLDTVTLYPHPPQKEWEETKSGIAKLVDKYKVELVAIGNGTAARETEQLVKEALAQNDHKIPYMVISEAGASVYSASEIASDEFPDMDVALRGAVSIARRLQDPLAELVKIEPKSVGVGQYQHDVNQTRLARALSGVVENCVNRVGVDVNTASSALLTYVAGLNKTLADNLVNYRQEHGRFANRDELLKVAQMGEKTFQQSAGFLRILDGENPLDGSGIHPEQYQLVDKVATQLGKPPASLLKDESVFKAIDISALSDEQYGEITVRDVLKELAKPGRDPRPRFRTAQFKEGVNELSDLEVGMALEGVVSNVTNFGAFVDIGVHQDGLVHISEMSKEFLRDPHKLVKAGQIVQVKVLEVDETRKRISLGLVVTKKANANKPPARTNHKAPPKHAKKQAHKKSQAAKPKSALGEALMNALKQNQ